MLTPKINIYVNEEYLFRGCHSFTVKRDVNDLSATGSVVFPLSAVKRNEQRELMQINRTVKAGNTLRIEAGYEETGLSVIFDGYVRTVDAKEQVTVNVEDAVYLLRRKAIVISELKPLPLKALCAKLLEGTPFKVSEDTADMQIDEFQHNGNVAGALDQLRKDLSLTVYITADRQLYAGGEQLQRNVPQVQLTYGRNIIDCDMQYRFAEDNPLLVTVKGKKTDNTEVVVEVGIKGGNEHTLYRYNVTDPATLRKIGEEYLLKTNYTGFKGSLKLFFVPLCDAGCTVVYRNENYADMEGKYFVKAVQYSFGTDSGLRQDVELGQRL